MRSAILSMLFLFTAACASYTPTPAHLSGELLTTRPPADNFRRITDDIHIDQAVLDFMRDRASSSGANLLAVIRMPRGIHPYAVIAWCQFGDTIQVLGTAVYWGRVDAKWNTRASAAELAGLTEAARAEFRCVEGRIPSALYGTGFVSWSGNGQISCENGLFAEQGSVFWSRLEEILDRAVETYNLFPDAPPN